MKTTNTVGVGNIDYICYTLVPKLWMFVI